MSNTVKQEFAVDGMICGGCVKSVTGAVSQLPGVRRSTCRWRRRRATVEYDGAAIAPAAIVAAIEAAGFEARAR